MRVQHGVIPAPPDLDPSGRFGPNTATTHNRNGVQYTNAKLFTFLSHNPNASYYEVDNTDTRVVKQEQMQHAKRTKLLNKIDEENPNGNPSSNMQMKEVCQEEIVCVCVWSIKIERCEHPRFVCVVPMRSITWFVNFVRKQAL